MSKQCDETLSREAVMYLRTSCWSLAQSGCLMTLEQKCRREDSSNLRPRQGTQATCVSHHLVLQYCKV